MGAAEYYGDDRAKEAIGESISLHTDGLIAEQRIVPCDSEDHHS